MPFQSAPNCASAALRFQYLGKEMVNVLNFHIHTGTYSQTDLDNLAGVLDGEVDASYKTLIPAAFTYLGVHVRGLTSAIDLEAIDVTHAGACTAVGSPAPVNASNCITLRTGHTGRSARGRFYAIPTVTGLQNDGAAWLSTYSAALVTMIGAFKSDAATVNWDLVILSRFSGGVRRVTATHLDVTFVEARNNEIDSQRGRLAVGH